MTKRCPMCGMVFEIADGEFERKMCSKDCATRKATIARAILKSKGLLRCTVCRQRGHNRRTCPQLSKTAGD